LTEDDVGDVSMIPNLLDQIEGPVGSTTGNGATRCVGLLGPGIWVCRASSGNRTAKNAVNIILTLGVVGDGYRAGFVRVDWPLCKAAVFVMSQIASRGSSRKSHTRGRGVGGRRGGSLRVCRQICPRYRGEFVRGRWRGRHSFD
jgi:hypothetical protein